MTISTILESMWLQVFDNSIIGALAIMAAFAYLCFKKKLGITETLIVCFPVLIGVSTVGCFGTTTSGCLPVYFTGIVIMGIGLLWGLALTKAFSSTEPYIKVYMLFLCMNAALWMYNYDTAPYVYSTTNTTADLLNDSVGLSGQGVGVGSISLEFLGDKITPIWNFFFGGAIIGFMKVSGLPSWLVTVIAYPIQAISTFIFLPVIWQFINALYSFGAAGIGILGKILRIQP